MQRPDPPRFTPDQTLDTAPVAWAALLSRWTDFARAGVAFPAEGEGGRWRASIAPVIGLQAVTFALGDIGRVAEADRPAALDIAEVLIRRDISRLHEIWRGEELHPELVSLVDDARMALAAARGMGVEWVVDVERFLAPDPVARARELVRAGFGGDFYAAAPGTILFRGAPAAWLAPGVEAAPWEGCVAAPGPGMRQVYRQLNESGDAVARDLVRRMDDTLPAGRPLLVPVVEEGKLVAAFDAGEAERWMRAQERLVGDGVVRVEVE